LLESGKHCEFRAAPEADAYALGSNSLWGNRDSTRRSDVFLRRAQRSRAWPCGHRHSHRHGGNAFDGDQLRPHGAGLPQRRFRLHVRGSRNPPGRGLCHGLEHGDGLHAQSTHLHDLVRAAGPRLCPRCSRLGMADFLRRCFYAAEYTRRKNVCASERDHGCVDERCYRNRIRRRGALHPWPPPQ